MMDFTIIIPHSGKDYFRKRNLKVVLDHYIAAFPDNMIIVSEQNSKTDLTNYDVKHLIIESELKFNKSKVINEAVTSHDSEYYLMIDNDCLLEPEYLSDLDLDNDLITPFNDIHFLTESQTRDYLKGNKDVRGETPLPVNKYTGGLTFFTKELFESIGGFDEDFVGWGGEDDAFITKALKLGFIYERTPGVVTHIYHKSEGTEEAKKSEGYKINRKRLLALKMMSSDDLIDKIENGKMYDDYFEKYEELYGTIEPDIGIPIGENIELRFDNSIYFAKDPYVLENALDAMIRNDGLQFTKDICSQLLEKKDKLYEEALWIISKYHSM